MNLQRKVEPAGSMTGVNMARAITFNYARARFRFSAILVLLDIAMVFVSFMLAGFLYNFRDDNWVAIASILVPLHLCFALNSHAYAADLIENIPRGIMRTLRSFVFAATLLVVVAFYLKTSTSFSRAVFSLGSTLSMFSLGLGREIFLRSAREILGGSPYSVAVISDDSQPINLAGVSMVIKSDDAIDPDDTSPSMYIRLADKLRYVDRVVVACAPERRMSWVQALKGANVRSEIVAPELLMLAPLALSNWNNAPTMVVADGPLGTVDTMLKRTFDIFVASTALILLSPVLLTIAILVKRSSPGPVLFVQDRIGRGNSKFKMRKFRSMRAETCDSDGHVSASRDDDRITPIGRFIRRTSLDELPQLINVLAGDMSIVGPRPHALGSRAEDKLFWEIDQRYWHRHAAKPGLTGLAQIRGYRGATRFERDLTDRLQADLEYLNHWSIWKDIQILFMTFRVLMHKNAY